MLYVWVVVIDEGDDEGGICEFVEVDCGVGCWLG